MCEMWTTESRRVGCLRCGERKGIEPKSDKLFDPILGILNSQ